MTEMHYYGLLMILTASFFVMMVLLRGRTKFMKALGTIIILFGVGLLAMTPYPAEIASALMGTSSVKVVPSPQ